MNPDQVLMHMTDKGGKQDGARKSKIDLVEMLPTKNVKIWDKSEECAFVTLLTTSSVLYFMMFSRLQPFPAATFLSDAILLAQRG